MSETRERGKAAARMMGAAMLDFDTCYRAAESRDARFDGRFLIAVSTTGVYCRPTCPSRLPKPHNVRFYRAAAAAEAAGFRACRRCHPEQAPESESWRSRNDIVARALRLIIAGAVDEVGVGGLAHQLGISERQLHRRLMEEMGAGPLALAESRRSQLARLLIQSTSLPLTEVAFAAGYTSIRRFNESLKAALGQAPSEFRRANQPDAAAAKMPIRLRLGYRPPFDGETLFTWLSARALNGVEYVDRTLHARTVRMAHGNGTIELNAETGSSSCSLQVTLTDIRDIGPTVRQCRDLLDLDCDPWTIGAALSEHPRLARLVAVRPGLRVPGCIDGFELAVRAVLGQQISVKAARTFSNRLVNRWGERVRTSDRRLTHLFPTPAQLAEAPLESIGLNARQAGTVRTLARAVAESRLSLDRSADREDTMQHLLALPGIGDWTASYIGMRALRDPDAFPAGDLGLRRAARHLGLPDGTRELREHSLRWRPWRAYAAMHLWFSLRERVIADQIGYQTDKRHPARSRTTPAA
jgi:AraC family transcriptional regulator of adaptative response / DNA-3-methyladenine glycosylase II